MFLNLVVKTIIATKNSDFYLQIKAEVIKVSFMFIDCRVSYWQDGEMKLN